MAGSTERNLLAEAVQRLHRACGLSFRAVCHKSNVSPAYIHQIENGKRNPTRAIVRSLDRALGGGGLLSALHVEEDPARRRAIFEVIALAAGGGLEYMRLLDGVTDAAPHRVGKSDVGAVTEAIDFCTSLDLRLGGYAAVGPGRAMLTWATRLLDAHMSDTVRRQLSAEVAALADRVGWASYDAGNSSAATRIYAVALRLAQESQDPNLVAHILIDASTQESHYGDHGKAADLLRTSLDTALLPSVRANVGMTYARHVANMGRSKEALAEVSRASDIAARSDPDRVPVWSKRFLTNPGHLTSVAARARLFAGAADQAASEFTSALESLSPDRARGRAYALCLLALAYLRGGYEDMASDAARSAAAAAASLKSLRVSGHLHTLADSFAAVHHSDLAHELLTASQSVAPSA